MLDREQRLIVETVRRIAEKRLRPEAAGLDATGSFPYRALETFAHNGLLNPLLPAQYGGVDASFLTFSLILEEIVKAGVDVSQTSK